MADIVRSRDADGEALMKQFKLLVQLVAQRMAADFLSPITITLGDEFQGVPKSLHKGMLAIVALEEAIVQQSIPIRLRYVLHHGAIDTPINPQRAHEMLGAGLTRARELLTSKKGQGNARFHVSLHNEIMDDVINDAMLLYGQTIDAWKPQDYVLIAAFLQFHDYKLVAQHLDKDRSLMWRRERSLNMSGYWASRRLLLKLTEHWEKK